MTTKKLVVSNYNSDLEWLKTTYDYGFSPKNTIIYDRSDVEKNWSHLGESIRSPNVGENIYDMMRFIVEHYDNLPDINIFIKGNMFSRPLGSYTTPERFYRALTAEYFLPIEKYYSNTAFFLNGGGYIEETWNAHKPRLARKYFSTLPELMKELFVDAPDFSYNRFAPGANYVVPKGNILKYTKSLYSKLMLYVSYEPKQISEEFVSTSGESYLIERLLYPLWTEDYIERK